MKFKCLLAAVPFIALLLQETPVRAQQKNENRVDGIPGSINIRRINTDSSGETKVEYIEDGHKHKIKLDGRKIVDISVDDKKIPAEDYSKYEAIVKKILVQVERDREQAEKDRKQAALDREQAERDRQQAVKDRNQADKDRIQADQERKRADEDRKHAEDERKLAGEDRNKADVNKKLADEDKKRSNEDKKQADRDRMEALSNREQLSKDRLQAEKDREQAEQDRAQAEKDRTQADKDRLQADKDRVQAEKDRKQAEKDRVQAEEDRQLMNEMIDELIKQKVVQNKDAIKSLTLNESELTVNGNRQPDILHQQFRTKYLKGNRGRINYKNGEGFRGMTIDK